MALRPGAFAAQNAVARLSSCWSFAACELLMVLALVTTRHLLTTAPSTGSCRRTTSCRARRASGNSERSFLQNTRLHGLRAWPRQLHTVTL
ncbi:unnamed protein product [Arctogadus glacialis]